MWGTTKEIDGKILFQKDSVTGRGLDAINKLTARLDLLEDHLGRLEDSVRLAEAERDVEKRWGVTIAYDVPWLPCSPLHMIKAQADGIPGLIGKGTTMRIAFYDLLPQLKGWFASAESVKMGEKDDS